jgi:two-component system, chemotaxis family, protein-glutamate methylesterase/glutaminase
LSLRKNKESFSRIVLIGCSSGGLAALASIAGNLQGDYPFPLIVVQHRAHDEKMLLEEILQTKTMLRVKQADEKENIENGNIYLAPPGYHLLIEKDLTFSLASDEPVNYSRPSIDVTLQSGAIACGKKVVSIILTGANSDGAKGIEAVKRAGGITIAEDPSTATFPYMPRAAIATGKVDHVMSIKDIGNYLSELGWKSTK